MWAVVNVDDGYPMLPPMATDVWLFASEDEAYEWANVNPDLDVANWNVVRVSDVAS